jgi:integrase/recombinase XerD
VIKRASNARGKPFKQNTIVDYIKILKQFYTWLIEREYSGIPKDRLSKLRAPPRDEMTKTASDLLTYDEVLAMARSCWREMDRALIMTLYEGGFRIGEIGKMTWGNLKFDDQGVVVNTDFKTGKPRYIRLILAAGHLAKWRGCYPGSPEGAAPVFITVNGPLSHAAVTKQLRRVAERAGIKRHITPHIFRHSRITHMIQKGISESVIKKMMWGTIDSRMFRTYVHLTGKDIDQELQRVYGLAPKDTESAMKKAMEPRVCPSCQTINSPVTNYCGTCGHELSEQAVRNLESALRRIQQNPDFKFIREMADKGARITQSN